MHVISCVNLNTGTNLHSGNIGDVCTDLLRDVFIDTHKTSQLGLDAWTLLAELTKLAENLNIQSQLHCIEIITIVSQTMIDTADPNQHLTCQTFLNKIGYFGRELQNTTLRKKPTAEITYDPLVSRPPTFSLRFFPRKVGSRTSMNAITPTIKQTLTNMAEIKAVATSCNYSVNDIKNLKPLDILQIGKTGNGKSALGNMILGRHIFKSKSSTISVTKEVEYDWVSFDNYLLKIVDAPGVSDTDNIKDFDKATQMIIDKMKHAVTFSPAGYHAFLLVVRYGNRFTAEDNFCIKMLKSIFGQDFVKNFCILIVTCGDLFITENPEISFSEWCKEQEGIFVELLQECDKRVLLFNNKSKDEKVWNEQVRKLIEEVEHLQTGGRRYTDKHFAEMAEDREKFILECKEPLIKEEILIHVNLIMRDLEELSNLEKEDQTNKLKELNQRARTLQKDVIENDRGTAILQQSIENIKGLLVLIGDKINFINDYTSLKQDLSQDHLKTENEPDEIENNSNVKSKSCSWRSDHAMESEEIEVNTSKKRIDKDVIAFQKNSPIKSSTRKTHSQYKIDSKINKDADDQQQTQSLEPVSVKCLSEKFDDIVRSKTTRPTPRSSVRTKSQQGEKETDFLEKEKEITKLQGRLIATQDLALKLMSDKDEREERLRNEVQLKLDQMALYLECKRLLDETMKTVSDRKKSRCRLS